MKILVLGVIIGLTLGYAWGFAEAAAGRPHVARRTLNKFGAATVERGNRRMEAALDSAGGTR